MPTINFKTIISILVIIAVAFGGYIFLSRSGFSPDVTATSDYTNVETTAVLQTLNQLQGIGKKLDPTIFSDPVFLSLKDFTAVVPAEAPGRPNPFQLPSAAAAASAPAAKSAPTH